jgi:hypothetical protein
VCHQFEIFVRHRDAWINTGWQLAPALIIRTGQSALTSQLRVASIARSNGRNLNSAPASSLL